MSELLPPGLYDELIDRRLRRELERLSERGLRVDERPLDDDQVADRLGRKFADVFRALVASKNAETRASRVRELRDWIARVDADLLAEGELELDDPPRQLLEIRAIREGLAETAPRARPLTPLADHALLLNSRGEPALAHEIRHELESADRIDLLIAFIKWSGIRLLEPAIVSALQRGVEFRVLTTTYMGASDAGAVEALARWGARVRISHDHRRTRLHAKAWCFHRHSGATTAYIGSSNLSRSAMLDGLEWNVRIAALESPTLIEKLSAAFETLWRSDEFQPFNPEDPEQVTHLARQLKVAGTGDAGPDSLTLFDLRPHDYQQVMLDALAAERQRGHHRNLVVAPTGVGKTMVAAFDYARLSTEAHRPRLLFVAHRERILDQSLATFRQVLRDPSFGEKLVGGARPGRGDHVFASIQSLNASERIAQLDPEAYDVVVVDEFHHASAPSYRRLLKHLRPRILLGLTATPERHDEQDILSWFDHRIASEMRLWDALEERLLTPFQYFGVHDGVDLSDVRFTRGRYDAEALERVYTGNDARARLVLQQLRRIVGSPERMRALGFCVSVQHAHFMAQKFSAAGLPSVAVTGDTPESERNRAIRRLEQGELRALFTVDLFNEGVDIPCVDTALFLRPTESATVFLQQLGRGLRLHPDKACLTVLDFIGNAHRDFRFDLRFRALMGGTTKQVEKQIEDDFPFLPPGCALQLDRVARDIVLKNVRAVTKAGVRWLSRELQTLGRQTSLSSFLEQADVDLFDLYSGSKHSWTALRDRAFGISAPRDDAQLRRLGRLGALLHVDDDERLDGFRALLSGATPADGSTPRLRHMLTEPFFSRQTVAEAAAHLDELRQDEAFVAEALELLDILRDRRRTIAEPWAEGGDAVPLHIHGHYRRDEVLAALGIFREGSVPTVQAGVFFDPASNTDLLFVTLKKTGAGFSPRTMYRDHALSPTLFHWESQHTAHAETQAGRRYLAGTSRVLLFVRHQTKWPNGLAEPFMFLGPARLESWSGGRPMQIIWRLAHAMPPELFTQARVAAR